MIYCSSNQFPSHTLASFIQPQAWYHSREVWAPDPWHKHWLFINLQHKSIKSIKIDKIQFKLKLNWYSMIKYTDC